MKRAIVISGGGSKGSYAVGIAQYYRDVQRNYDIFIGSSTGALIASLLAADNYKNLIESYSSISHKDIFSISPFKIKKSKGGVYKYSINHWGALYNMIIKKRPSLGDSTVFRKKTIPKFFTEEDFVKIRGKGRDLNICVSNLTLEKGEVKSSKDYNYDQFCDWMWASTCVPPFMSIVEVDGYEYVDGALLNMVPIEHAILAGADEIDIILLEKEYPKLSNIEKVRNVLHFIDKISDMMTSKIKRQNMNLGYLTHLAEKDIQLNFHYTERKLTNNSLIFNKDLMNEWREEGYEYAKKGDIKRYLLMGESNTYKLIQ